MSIIRKGLQFDDSVRAEAQAADVLALAGRKQSVFVTILVEKFLADNDIADVGSLTRAELDAAIVNTGRLVCSDVSMARHNARNLAQGNYTKNTDNPSRAAEEHDKSADRQPVFLSETEDSDGIDDEMARMLEAFG